MRTLAVTLAILFGVMWSLWQCILPVVYGGTMIPLILLIVLFWVVFALIGCLDTGYRMSNLIGWGYVVASAGLAILAILASDNYGSLIIGVAMAAFGVIGALASLKDSGDSHAH